MPLLLWPQSLNDKDVLKPDIVSKEITSDDKFVILASHGVWSVMDAQQAVDLVMEFLSVFKNSKAASEELVDEALRKNAEDNVSVVVVWFQEDWDEKAVGSTSTCIHAIRTFVR